MMSVLGHNGGVGLSKSDSIYGTVISFTTHLSSVTLYVPSFAPRDVMYPTQRGLGYEATNCPR